MTDSKYEADISELEEREQMLQEVMFSKNARIEILIGFKGSSTYLD